MRPGDPVRLKSGLSLVTGDDRQARFEAGARFTVRAVDYEHEVATLRHHAIDLVVCPTDVLEPAPASAPAAA